jgi:hypothetical protein
MTTNTFDAARAESLCLILAEDVLDQVRRYPTILPEWREGRAAAAALIYPCVETLSAANETRFLVNDYARRHGGAR